MESSSLPTRTSRNTASQDKQDRQQGQQEQQDQPDDVSTDLARMSRVDQITSSEGEAVGVGAGAGVRPRRDLGFPAAATTTKPKTEQDFEDDNADEDDDDQDEDEDDQDEKGDLPMSMTASVILTNLPKDASEALKEVEEMDDKKVSIRFQPLGSAPILKQKVFKISSSSKFSVVLNFLRKKIGTKSGDGLFLYVNSVFAPGLDESVGNLFRCFKTDDQLIVSYSNTPAFG